MRLLALLLACTSGAVAADKPNIVFILADDLGYGDVSCNGATKIQTPNIDKLAANGRRFTSGYCSASTCTPTRYSLLTGTYAFRAPNTGIAPPNAAALIKPGMETVGTILKRAGYATAVIGKWHLGLGEKEPDWNGDLKPGPLEIGFDRAYLLPTTNDRVPSVYIDDHKVKNLDPKDPLWVGMKKPTTDDQDGIILRDKLRMDWSHGHNNTVHNGIGRIGFFTGGEKARWRDEDLADEWITQSTTWIEKKKEKPFFLFFSSHDIHVPRMPHERFQGKSPMGFRGDAILEFDWSVGELMKTLDKHKLTENTLVIVCSDNGPVLDDGYKDGAVEKVGDHKPAGPYRGGKTTVFEGGTRTPFIAHWPAKIKPAVSDEMICTIDMAATFAAMFGQKLDPEGCLDSLDMKGVLLGEAGAKGREELVQQANNPNQLGFRAGNWKLVRQAFPKKAKGTATEQLFDLATDPGETKNVAAANAATAKALSGRLDAILTGRTRVVK